ncbi:Iron-sulfur cluster-binding domain protein [uncultured archaeon]|nr:Iron-sulfur cluster-binding domain protein [uncultured archaeon]
MSLTYKYDSLEAAAKVGNSLHANVVRGDCPCRCVHCPVGLTPPAERGAKFGSRHMSLPTFKLIVGQLSELPDFTLRLHGVGEPLRWKHLRESLGTVKTAPMRSVIFTSGIGPQDLLADVVRSFDIVEVSVNSFNREHYLATKGVDAFDQVLSNMEFMRKVIRQEKLSTKIIASKVGDGTDAEFVQYWNESGIVDDAFARVYHSFTGLIGERGGNPNGRLQPCIVPWKRLNVDYDGKVVVCFDELFKESVPSEDIIMGDVRKQTLKEIFNGERFESVRAAHMAMSRGQPFDRAVAGPCATCRRRNFMEFL